MPAAVRRFTLLGILVFVLVAAPLSLWIRHWARTESLQESLGITQRLAEYAIAPLVTADLLRGDRAAIEALDARLRPWLDETLLRVKVWDERGTVVYSDVHSLIGDNYGPAQWAEVVLDGTEGTATMEAQDEAENLFESDAGELVEVYVSSPADDGQRLIFEAYYDGARVREQEVALLASVGPAVLLALALLQLALLAPAVQLARRVEVAQLRERRVLQQAVDSSERERRRIARDLHDDVIQNLAGLAYAVEAEEMRAPAEQQPLLRRARELLQASVRTLRAMTSELYPPDLEELGLPTALNRLTAPLSDRGLEVSVDAPASVELDRERAVILYRVAREVLANIAKHAGASRAEVSLRQEGGVVVLRVRDDGSGFDADTGPPEGHLGLRLITDALADAGGSLRVSSTRGGGTEVTATI